MEIQVKVVAVLNPQTYTSQKNGNTYVTNQFVIVVHQFFYLFL